MTTDPAAAVAFASDSSSDIAVKPLATPHVYDGDQMFEIYAQRLSPSALIAEAERVKYAPCILQEYVTKVAEYRITVIGHDVFSVKLDTNEVEDADVDWRRADPTIVPHLPAKLPENLERAIMEFLRIQELRHGAIDLLESPEGEYIFLENNPSGAWYWIEQMTGLPLARSMLRLLTQRSN